MVKSLLCKFMMLITDNNSANSESSNTELSDHGNIRKWKIIFYTIYISLVSIVIARYMWFLCIIWATYFYKSCYNVKDSAVLNLITLLCWNCFVLESSNTKAVPEGKKIIFPLPESSKQSICTVWWTECWMSLRYVLAIENCARWVIVMKQLKCSI